MSAGRATRQTTVLTAVLGIHVVIGLGLIAGMTIRNLSPRSHPIDLILIPPDAPQLDLTPPPLNDPKIPNLDLPRLPDIPIVPRNFEPVHVIQLEEAGKTSPPPPRVSPIIQASVKDVRALAEAASSCYPSASRRLGEEGLVLLKVYVTAAGDITDAVVESSSGVERLDDAAARCVKSNQLRGMWVPQTIDGHRVGAWMHLPWRWKLG